MKLLIKGIPPSIRMESIEAFFRRYSEVTLFTPIIPPDQFGIPQRPDSAFVILSDNEGSEVIEKVKAHPDFNLFSISEHVTPANLNADSFGVRTRPVSSPFDNILDSTIEEWPD